MTKTAIRLAICAICTLALAACSDDDSPNFVVTRPYAECFYSVYNTETKETTIVPDGSLTVAFDYTAMKATVTIKNVPTTSTPRDITITQMPMEISSSQYIKVDADKASVSNVTLTDFTLKWRDNSVDTDYRPVVRMSFTVNDKLQVRLFPKTVWVEGSTVTTLPGDSTYTDSKSLYIITTDPKTMQATINIKSAKFAADMPALDMNFSGIAASVDDAYLYLRASSLIPTINDTPYPGYEVTNLSGSIEGEWTTRLTFTVGSLGTVRATLAY